MVGGRHFDAVRPAVAKPATALTTWQPGSDARLVLAMGYQVVAVPTGYLATVKLGTGYVLCWSPNLLDWYPADSNHFLNRTGTTFYPVGAVAVTKGYAAAAVEDPAKAGFGDADYRLHSPDAEWYSPDGISWSRGIPAAARVRKTMVGLEWPCTPGLDGYGDCLYAGSLEMEVDGLTASRDGGKTYATPAFPSNVEVDVFEQLQRLADKSYAALVSIVDDSAPPPTCKKCVVAEPPLKTVLMASTDGIRWRLISGKTGESILARPEGLYLMVDGALWISKDDCKAWTQIGDKLNSGWLTLAGEHPIVVNPADASSQGTILAATISLIGI